MVRLFGSGGKGAWVFFFFFFMWGGSVHVLCEVSPIQEVKDLPEIACDQGSRHQTGTST